MVSHERTSCMAARKGSVQSRTKISGLLRSWSRTTPGRPAGPPAPRRLPGTRGEDAMAAIHESSALGVLDAEIREQFGDTARFSAGPAASPRSLVDIFEASVRSYPDELALDDGTRPLTYRALAVEVENLRRRLSTAGVGLGDRVGVRVPSGTNDLYVAILAVLAAGAA